MKKSMERRRVVAAGVERGMDGVYRDNANERASEFELASYPSGRPFLP
jgi:hypothetical protein